MYFDAMEKAMQKLEDDNTEDDVKRDLVSVVAGSALSFRDSYSFHCLHYLFSVHPYFLHLPCCTF